VRRLIATLTAALLAAPAFASQPTRGALGFQDPATRIAERVHEFHNMVLVIITAITLFVLALLIWVVVRYNSRANPVARKFSHNTLVEVVWTVVPALILVAIAIPSFPNLYYQDVVPNFEKIKNRNDALLEKGEAGEAELARFRKDHFPEAAAKGFINIKAQGNQWNWTYSYPDITDADGAAIEFVSNPIFTGTSKDPKPSLAQPRNLATDYPLVLPAGRYIRYYTAAADVIHSWTVPAFGVKTDAVPGRLNEGWFLVDKPGVYYGQCSELCGVNHAFMPIEVRVVPEADFDRWTALMKTGDIDAATASIRAVASAETDNQFASITR
jgi:cytochrome c oxidase subunit II